MAIRIIEGKIGSGKTYYAVNHVFKSWFKWCDKTDTWVNKDSEIDLKVYTNIANMKIGFDLNNAIEEAGGLNPFFTEKFQIEFCEELNVVYIIDEAQSYDLFHRSYKDKEVLTFFQKSRHLGIDIYLVTQDTQTLAKELRNLAEYHIVAVQRTKTLGNMFTYKFYAGKDCFKTKRIKKDPKIFSLYRSMIEKEVEKVRSAALKYIIMFVLIIGLAVGMFKFVFLDRVLGMKATKDVVKAEEPIKVVQSADFTIKSDNKYKIIGIVNNSYVVKTNSGIKKVKIQSGDLYRIHDYITIENL